MIQAASASYSNGQWTFFQGFETRFRHHEVISATSFETRTYGFQETDEDFAAISLNPRRMSFGKLRDYIGMMVSSGEDPSRYMTELHLKLSFPFSCLVFTLLSLLVSFRMRAANLTFELGLTAAIALAYYGLTSIMADLGTREVLPSWIAAWLPTVLFGVGSVVSLILVRTDHS